MVRDLPTGVRKAGKRFIAAVNVKGRNLYLGTFDTAEEASETFQEARRQNPRTFRPGDKDPWNEFIFPGEETFYIQKRENLQLFHLFTDNGPQEYQDFCRQVVDMFYELGEEPGVMKKYSYLLRHLCREIWLLKYKSEVAEIMKEQQ